MSRVLLVDDHEIVRRGLAEIIAARAIWRSPASAAVGRLFALVESTSPDVVVMTCACRDAARRALRGSAATNPVLRW